ncbi:FixH family protein [bacterium]|nr:FixH family protein [bacterium]
MAEKTKRNLWPAGLITVLGLFALWLTVFIIYASSQRSNLVSPTYYSEELKYQEQIDRVNRSNSLENNVAITFQPRMGKILLKFPQNLDYSQITGEVELFRPSDDRLDIMLPINPDADHKQVIPTSKLQSGMWKVRVWWNYGGLEYYAEEVIVQP